MPPEQEDPTVETGERLAAYLAGELDADEVRALEADLAREPGLRARLAAIRATDEALAGLPEVAVPAAFSTQLRAAVADELEQQLGGDGSGAGDELAARRLRRGAGGARRAEGRTWWPQLAAAAAVLAVIGTVSIGVLSGGGDDAATDEGGEVALESMAAEPAAGPTVVAAGRSFDTDSLVDLADDARFDEIVTQGLSGADASRMAVEHEEAIEGDSSIAGSGPADGGEAATDSAESDTSVTMQAPPADDIGLRTVGEVSDADLEAVRRCLPELLEADAAVIPVYVELATFEGADAIVYGLVGNDPDQESYRRVELWVVDRADCQVLHFAQVDR